MSREVAALVYSRRVGSGPKKAVLSYMAEKASTDGSGVFASKATISAAVELGKSTVIRATNDLLREGIIEETGSRRCVSGATTVYRINLAAVEALPAARMDDEAVPERDTMLSQSGTPIPPVDGQAVPERDTPVPERDTMLSQSGTQTVLEPSFNHGGGGKAREGMTLLERCCEAAGSTFGAMTPSGRCFGSQADGWEVQRWADDLGLSDDEIVTEVARIAASKPDGPPSSLRYFSGGMARLAGAKARPALVPVAGGIPRASPEPGRSNRELAEIALAKIEAEEAAIAKMRTRH